MKTVEKFKNMQKNVTLAKTFESIDNIFGLEYVGAGHDGYVFKKGDTAYKLLKYSITDRKARDLMTFEKAQYFANNCSFKRFTAPKDIILDGDGVYCGYTMDYLDSLTDDKKKGTPLYRKPSSYLCGDLVNSISEFNTDIEELNEQKILIQDINNGSYVFTSDFMHFVDMDKFKVYVNGISYIRNQNANSFNKLIAKFLYNEMVKVKGKLTPDEKKIFDKWIKLCINEKNYLSNLEKEIGLDYEVPISEYVSRKVKKILN